MPESAPRNINSKMIDRDDYMAGLQRADRENLDSLSDAFVGLFSRKRISATLLAVGSSVRPTAGKIPSDIDLVVISQDFSFPGLVEVAASLSQYTGFEISATTPPLPDLDFPEILRHVGSVRLLPPEGKSIEITREEHEMLSEEIIDRNRKKGLPQCILATTAKSF